jgi:hypothetical protein
LQITIEGLQKQIEVDADGDYGEIRTRGNNVRVTSQEDQAE